MEAHYVTCMTTHKLFALIIITLLTFAFAWLLSAGVIGIAGGTICGIIVATASAALIYNASTGKRAYARGFLALGATFILVPFVNLFAIGDQVVSNLPALSNGEQALQDEIFLASFVASAGLIFGLVIGCILVAIGALMHLKPKTAIPPPLR